MRLFIYDNGLCDPVKNIGVCRQFGSASDVDAYVHMFVASLNPRSFNRYRLFVTNDDVEFAEVDHFTLFNEKIGLDMTLGNKIKELNVWEIAKEVNKTFQELDKKRSLARAQAEKNAKERPPPEIMPKSFDVV